jgi:hypothetical protein
MQAIVTTTHIDISVEEREIILELLDRERTNLPVEIHHTRTARFRDVLKQRLDAIDMLYEKVTSS